MSRPKLLPADAIGASRRPGVLCALWLLRAALAVAIAAPFGAIAEHALGAFPRGDAMLFEPGGMYLVEVSRVGHLGLAAASREALLIALVAAYLGLVPLAAELDALGRSGRVTLASSLSAGLRPLGALSWLLGASVAATVALAFLAGAVVTAIGGAVNVHASDRTVDLVRLSIVAVAAACAVAVGVVHDFARAAAVRTGSAALTALYAGAATFGRAPLRAVWNWALWAVTALAVVALATVATARIGVATGPRFAAVAVVHQVAALALVFLRASWLAWVLARVAERADASAFHPDDRAD